MKPPLSLLWFWVLRGISECCPKHKVKMPETSTPQAVSCVPPWSPVPSQSIPPGVQTILLSNAASVTTLPAQEPLSGRPNHWRDCPGIIYRYNYFIFSAAVVVCLLCPTYRLNVTVACVCRRKRYCDAGFGPSVTLGIPAYPKASCFSTACTVQERSAWHGGQSPGNTKHQRRSKLSHNSAGKEAVERGHPSICSSSGTVTPSADTAHALDGAEGRRGLPAPHSHSTRTSLGGALPRLAPHQRQPLPALWECGKPSCVTRPSGSVNSSCVTKFRTVALQRHRLRAGRCPEWDPPEVP